MIDIWGRSISALEKPTTGTQTTDDIKKIIEDEIAETLNLASVNPGEIVIFQDRQGKLKTSNVSLDDILIRRCDAADNTIALFQDGKIKPGALVSTVTEKLTTVDNTANSLKSLNDEFVKFNQSLQEFLGVPPETTPNIATIKTAIDNLAKLRSDYDTHIAAFGALRKNFIRTDDAVLFFLAKKYQTGGY